MDYQSKLSQAQGREIDRRDYLFEREQKALKDSAVASSNQEKYLRKVHQQNAYNEIKDQVNLALHQNCDGLSSNLEYTWVFL